MISLFIVCCYLANVLHFIDINFQKPCDTYKILIQGRPDTFFTFSSIDVTYPIFACIASIPAFSTLLAIIPYLRNKGYTYEIIKEILTHNLKTCLFNLIISICSGLLGILYCYLKTCHADNTWGHPQYMRYYFFVFAIVFLVSFSILIFRKRHEYRQIK